MKGCCQLKHFYLLWNNFDFSKGIPLKGILRPIDGYDMDDAVAFGNDSYIIFIFLEEPGGMSVCWIVGMMDIFCNG